MNVINGIGLCLIVSALGAGTNTNGEGYM